MPNVKLTDAERFFYEHSGFSHSLDESPTSGRTRGAILMAFAERESARRGWSVIWEIDQDADTVPTEDYFVSGNPQWIATLNGEHDEYLASLCGIDFAEDYSGSDPTSDPYARVVAAELTYQSI